jgi:UDP-N-acetylglucosamine--N-acetylmuramyl-(pentapeptide) pyrophosphoryl-undecaprenol N-acetylglucosamine transferase
VSARGTVVFAGGGTGGHLYPGLAIARALVKRAPEVRPFFVGARRGIEREVLPTTEFEHELLDLHPLYRQRPWENWKTLRGAFGAWRRFGTLAREREVRLVVGTGGYASGLALAWAAAHRMPYALQEQNSFPGLTMRVFSRWAREVWLGFPEAGKILKPGDATRLVDAGNPIDPPPEPRPDRAAARRGWGLPGTGGHVLLVFGGSQGARAVNETVAQWLDAGRLPEGLHVIWATGKGSYDAFARHEGERVRVRPYLAPMSEAYAATDFAIARAGAMGTAEMVAWGIPSILVPLPTAAADHQSANARSLAAAGAALVLEQQALTVDTLDAAVRELASSETRLAELSAAARARGRPDAAARIAERLVALL